jgi:hypothetical protein
MSESARCRIGPLADAHQGRTCSHEGPSGELPLASSPLGRFEAPWAGTRWYKKISYWSIRRRPRSTWSTWRRCRRRQLFAKPENSTGKREFGCGRQERCFLEHRLSAEGVLVDPSKVQSMVELGDADLVHRGAALHGPDQLPQTVCGGLRRNCSTADGVGQPRC